MRDAALKELIGKIMGGAKPPGDVRPTKVWYWPDGTSDQLDRIRKILSKGREAA